MVENVSANESAKNIVSNAESAIANENAVVSDDAPQEIVEPDLEPVPVIQCPRCGQSKPRARKSPHMCVDCEKAENVRITYFRRHQDNWMETAAEAGLDLWVQQPGETQWEFTVWQAYRDSYPGKRASYTDIAVQLNTTYNVVKKIAQRWSFPVRMQAWIQECDRMTLLQRRQEVLDMNKAHVDMASKLRTKLSTAIDSLDPQTLAPKDINSLAKLATALERQARLDTIDQEALRKELLVDTENPELKKSPTQQNDLSEVVQILLKAGALGDITQIGVRQTQTTEIVVKDGEGNSSSLEMEE